MIIKKNKKNKGFTPTPFYKTRSKTGAGFTLIEFIIYITIVVGILVVTINFAWDIVYGNLKSQAIREVQQNARFSMERITKSIEQATGINSPASGNPANLLSLKMSDLNLNPTVFDVSDGKLRITQGTNGPYNLTNERVEITNLQFTNLSYSDTPGALKIEMTINHINPTGQSEYDVSFSLGSSASLRPGAEPVVSGWHNPNWSYRKKITILASQVAADLTDFPVLISTIDPDLIKAQSDGDDILFTSSDGVVKLNHEIEDFDYPATKLVAWVKSDISSTQDTDIYMYYGYSGALNQQNPTQVWDDNYKAVYHLGDDPTSTVYDSTSNNVNLTGNAMESYDMESGKIGDCINFDGDPERLVSSVNVSVESFTIEAWVSVDTWVGWRTFIGISNGNDWRDFGAVNGNPFIDDGTAYDIAPIQSGSTWRHIVARYDNNAGSERLRGFINGQITSNINNPSFTSFTDNVSLAALDYFGSWVDYLNGRLDEVRISDNTRSNGWILTEYNNQSDPSSFYIISTEEALGNGEPAWHNPNWSYRKKITILASQVAADLTDFPVLISTIDPDLIKAQSDGDDILFTSSDGVVKLNHEIEDFDYPTSNLVAWVNIPSLSSTQDTEIYMYYGNSGALNQQNPTAVWDSNYVGVWHLDELSGNAQDSTSYNTSGTPSGGVTRGQTGQIDGAYDFDGIDGQVSMGDPADGHLDFGTNSFTLSAWLNIDDSTENYQLPLFKGGYTPEVPGYDWETDSGGSYLYAAICDGSTLIPSSFIWITYDKWMNVVTVVNRSLNTFHIYKDSVEEAPVDISSINNIDTDKGLQFSPESWAYLGMLDEVRISNIARSDEWISTEYNNQSNSSTFYIIGSEETGS